MEATRAHLSWGAWKNQTSRWESWGHGKGWRREARVSRIEYKSWQNVRKSCQKSLNSMKVCRVKHLFFEKRLLNFLQTFGGTLRKSKAITFRQWRDRLHFVRRSFPLLPPFAEKVRRMCKNDLRQMWTRICIDSGRQYSASSAKFSLFNHLILNVILTHFTYRLNHFWRVTK